MSPKTRSTGDSPSRPDSVPDWKRHCSNKREKKEVLSGKRDRGKKTGGPAQGTDEKASREKGGDEGTVDEEYGLSIRACFSGLTDPRINRRRRHLLLDIVVIVMCATICGGEGWKDIQLRGETHIVNAIAYFGGTLNSMWM